MKGASSASTYSSLICPLCEGGELRPSGQHSARCDSCAGLVSKAVLEALREITACQTPWGHTPARSAATPRCGASPTGYPIVRPAVLRFYPLSLNAARKPSAREEAIAKAVGDISTRLQH